MRYSTSNPNGVELDCVKCLEGVTISSPDGVNLLSATSFIVDHSDCEFNSNEDDECSPMLVLEKVVDLANLMGVTDKSQNGGLL